MVPCSPLAALLLPLCWPRTTLGPCCSRSALIYRRAVCPCPLGPLSGACPGDDPILRNVSQSGTGPLVPAPAVLSMAAVMPSLSPFPTCPINQPLRTLASRCVINNLEPMFMDSAISAAFTTITFLQRLHEGFLLLQLFCFIYSLLLLPCQLVPRRSCRMGRRLWGVTGSYGRRGVNGELSNSQVPL